jgi:hypothetical protein
VDSFISNLLSTFLVDMAQRVIVENFDASRFVDGLLDSAPIVGRHTSIVHLSKTEKGVAGQKYVWSNEHVRPWGHVLPAQCPKCFSHLPWGKKVVARSKGNNTICFTCMGRKANSSHCGNVVVYEKPENIVRISGAGWLTFRWP